MTTYLLFVSIVLVMFRDCLKVVANLPFDLLRVVTLGKLNDGLGIVFSLQIVSLQLLNSIVKKKLLQN